MDNYFLAIFARSSIIYLQTLEMKSFWKMFFASLLAMIVMLIITGSILIIIMVGMMASLSTTNAPKPIKANSILKIDLNSISDTYISNPWDGVLNGADADSKSLPLSVVLDAIKEAKSNDNVQGIYLNIVDPGCGYATAEAVRRALVDFKQSGKFIYSYSDIYSLKGYYLASTADKLYVNPEGSIAFDGLVGSGMFYKDLLEKIGVEMMVFKVGTFKSAVEPYILNKMSEPNREQVSSYLGDIWGRILKEVGSSRSLDVTKLQSLADSLQSLQPATTYLANGLVDQLMYADEALEAVASIAGEEKVDDLRFISIRDLHQTIRTKRKEAGKIGVIFAEGGIEATTTDSPLSGKKAITGSLCEDILDMAEDENYDAIVIRVNSPGGSSYISEQLWHAVDKAKQSKPVVISMGDYAASGGYYMSAGASKIYAEPSTITGSIGIFGLVPNAAKLADKVGVHLDFVKTAAHADLGAMDRPWSEEEKSIMQQYVNRGYQLFLKRVSDGRKMSTAAVDSIAQGRVWTGAQALKLGLVDELGGLQDAIEGAAQLAGISNYHVAYTKRETNLLEELLQSSTRTVKMEILSTWLTKQEIEQIEEARAVRALSGLQARLPYEYEL